MVGEGKVPLQSKWYRVGSVNQKGQGSDLVVKMINPTQQVVDRAKQEIQRVSHESKLHNPGRVIKRRHKKKSVQSRTKPGRGRTAKKPGKERLVKRPLKKKKVNNSKRKPVKRLGAKRNQKWNLSG